MALFSDLALTLVHACRVATVAHCAGAPHVLPLPAAGTRGIFGLCSSSMRPSCDLAFSKFICLQKSKFAQTCKLSSRLSLYWRSGTITRAYHLAPFVAGARLADVAHCGIGFALVLQRWCCLCAGSRVSAIGTARSHLTWNNIPHTKRHVFNPVRPPVLLHMEVHDVALHNVATILFCWEKRHIAWVRQLKAVMRLRLSPNFHEP